MLISDVGGDRFGTAALNLNVNALANGIQLRCKAGANKLIATNFADRVEGGGGADTINGGTGIETLRCESSLLGMTVNLTTGAASGGDARGDSFAGFENLTGGRGDDSLTGTVGLNVWFGGAGSDTRIGMAGDDTLNGGTGAGSLIGGTGADAFVFSTALGASNIDTISLYSVADDAIQLDHSIFTGLALGTLDASAFVAS